MGGTREPVVPARWDVPRGDRLGSLPLRPDPSGCRTPTDPYRRHDRSRHAPYRYDYRPEILETAARTLARSGGGALYFPGRSCDSLRDVLATVLAGTSHADHVRFLPFSIRDAAAFTPDDLRQWRVNSATLGLEPAALARARSPVTLCDLVWQARTFGFHYRALREWAEDEGEPWDVIRRRLRFLGLVRRRKTSPKTWRWAQSDESAWVRELPHAAVTNISITPHVWDYLGNRQEKLTESFTRLRWNDPEQAAQRGRDDATRRALHEAETLVAYTRSAEGRAQFVRTLVEDRAAMRAPWLRALVGELRGTDAARRTGRVNASRLASAARR